MKMKNYIILLSVLILASCSNQNKQKEVSKSLFEKTLQC